MTTYRALGGDWGTSTSWNPATVPDSPDADVLLASPSASVTLASGSSFSIRSLSVDDDSLWLNGALTAAQAASFVDAASLTLDGGALTASQITVGSGSTLRGTGVVNGPVTDNGTIFAGAHTPQTYPANEIPESLVINGDVGGSGILEIGGGVSSVGSHAYSRGYGTITLNGRSANTVLFEGGFGTLKLGDPSAYTGAISAENVSAFDIYYTVYAAFEIDLSGVSYASVRNYSYSQDANGGVLAIETTAGNYAYKFAGGFELSDFALGGTSDLAITVTPKPIITGTVAGQQIDSSQSIRPFATIQISDSLVAYANNDNAEISVSGGSGTWSNLGPGLLGGSGDYYVNGDPAGIVAALQALVFTPTPDTLGAAPETLSFTVTYSDYREPVVTDATTTVVVSSATSGISRPGVTVNASQTPVSFTANGGDGTINGDFDAISAPPGLNFTINGVHDAAYLANGRVYLGPHADVSIVGDSELAFGSGDGETVGFIGTGDVAYLANGVVYLGANTNAVVVGDGNVANTSASGDVVGFVGRRNVAEIANGTVYLGAGADVAVVGDDDVVATSASGDVMGFVGKRDIAEISNGTVYLAAGSDVVVLGNDDVVNTAASGVTLGYVGHGGTAEMSQGVIYLGGSTDLSVVGDDNVVNTSAAGDVLTFNGEGNIAEVTDCTVNLGAGSSVSILGDGDIANAGALRGASMSFTGSGDTAQISAGTVGLQNASVSLVGGFDTISLSHLFGANTLYGFNGSDSLQFDSRDFASADDVLSQAVQSGGDTLIYLDSNDYLVLSGVTATSLSASRISIV